VSIVLASHGDAVIFGASGQHDSRSNSSKRPSNAMIDAKFYTPSRVRRRDRKGSGEDVDWRTQRGGSASLLALQSVALGSEDAFGVDTEGNLWMWDLRQRPCMAEAMTVAPLSGVSSDRSGSDVDRTIEQLVLPEEGWTTVAVGSGNLWGTDRSPAASIWQLRRTTSAERSRGQLTKWIAERWEELGQASCVACSPEHQAAIVNYQRPVPPSALPGESIAPIGCDEDSSDGEGQQNSKKASTMHEPTAATAGVREPVVAAVVPTEFQTCM
jgi:hypothetical protein